MILKRPLITSALCHLLMFLFLSVWQYFTFSKQHDLAVTWVELPKGMSEDIGTGMKKAASLPQSTIQEQKQPPAPKAHQIKKESPKMKKEPPKLTQKRTKSLSETDRKIQAALGNIDKALAERATPEAAQVKENEEGYKYGTGDEPLRVSPDDPEYLKYQAEVRMKIINEWILPTRYMEEEIARNAKLEVFIDDHGDVTSTRFLDRSGDESFDASALRAVQRASPLPKPPDRLSSETYQEGFLIEFDPRLKQ